MLDLKKKGDLVEIHAEGTLTAADYEELIPEIEEAAEKSGPLRLYIELRDFSGWTPAALWKDIRFDLGHQDDMDRIAVVGESSVEEWGTKLSKPFIKADTRFFPRDEAKEAMRWVLES